MEGTAQNLIQTNHNMWLDKLTTNGNNMPENKTNAIHPEPVEGYNKTKS